MTQDFQQWLDELLSRVNIVDIVSKYLPLTKKGNTYWGCCPFHHEKDPSFAVNEDRQFFHCFGCKESGNAITFVKKIESIDFMDAVRILAKDAKMEIPQFKSNSSQDNQDYKEKENLYKLMRDAAFHYHQNLSSPQAKLANEYISNRQIPDNLVVKFGLGFSMNGNEIITYLLDKGYTYKQMKLAGLIEQKADKYYDVFYNRLIFPIINNLGQVVAFGGRLLDLSTHIPVKYRNSSQTLIFDKSKTIYGINLLKKKKQKENIKYIIMTEGYMDVIALHKAGFDTAVASMGTALTIQQAKQLKNICDTVYICYDGDTAGQKATLRGLDILRDVGINVKVVSLPEGLDPDDVIKKYGRNKYEELLTQAQSLPEFKINSLRKEYDFSDAEQKSNFGIEAIKIIKQLDNPVEREELLKVVHNLTDYSMETLKKQAELTDVDMSRVNIQQIDNIENKPEFNESEIFVLACFAHQKEFVKITEDIYPYLTCDDAREIYSQVLERVKNGTYVNPAFLYNFENNSLVKLILDYQFMEGDNEKKFQNLLRNLKIDTLMREKEELSIQADEAQKEKDTSKCLEILKKILKLDNQIKTIKNSGGFNDRG